MEEKNFAQRFLEELWALDEPTKRKVLVISTIVIMIVVVFVWVAYFNNIVVSSATEANEATATSTATSSASTGSGFWGGIKSGFSNIFHGGKQAVQPSH